MGINEKIIKILWKKFILTFCSQILSEKIRKLNEGYNMNFT